MSPRRLTALVLATAIGSIPLVPPEHVHESHDADHHTIVHRHVEAHAIGHHVADHEPVVDEGDGPEFDLGAAFVIPIAPGVPAPPAVPAVVELEPPVVTPLHRAADDVELLIHGPPRAPASLRAPPASQLA